MSGVEDLYSLLCVIFLKNIKVNVYAVTGPDCFKNQMWKYSDVDCISNVSVLICSLTKIRVLNKPSFVTNKFFVKTSAFFE